MTSLLVGEAGSAAGEFAAAARGASRRSDRIGAGFVIGGDSSDRLIGDGASLGLKEVVGIVFVLSRLPHPPSRHHNRLVGGLRSKERENLEKGR